MPTWSPSLPAVLACALVSMPSAWPQPGGERPSPASAAAAAPQEEAASATMAGVWIDPETGSETSIRVEGTGFAVASVVDDDGERFEVKESAWADGVLRWVYHVPSTGCNVTFRTTALRGDELHCVWSNDQGRKGDQVLTRKGVAPAPDAYLLTVCPSDRDNEKRIGDYFERHHHWKISYHLYNNNPDDLILRITFSVDEAPSVEFNIDCQSSATSAAGEVTEMRIKIWAWFAWGMKPDHEARARALEALNEYTNRYWAPQCVYIDGDGDLVLQSSVNIPGKDHPVHAELIADWVIRMTRGWQELHGILKERGLPLPVRGN